MSKIKLSLRVRPDCEAAPWVIEEIKLLEAHSDKLQVILDKLYARSCYESAKVHGLEWEFWWSYKQSRRGGGTIRESAWHAICEWDL